MSFPTSPTEGQIYNEYRFNNGMWNVKSNEDKPRFKIGVAATFTSSTADHLLLPLDTIIIDNNNLFDTSTGKLLIEEDGDYFLGFDYELNSSSVINGLWYYPGTFWKNGVIIQGNDTHSTSNKYHSGSISGVYSLLAGDYIQVKNHTGDGATSLTYSAGVSPAGNCDIRFYGFMI